MMMTLWGGEARVCPGELERWGAWPNPTGLACGLLAVLVSQMLVIAYHYARVHWCHKAPHPTFWTRMHSHLTNLGGMLMMAAYLCVTWMVDLLPCSYYRVGDGVRWCMVASQIVMQDLLMFLVHYMEHNNSLGLYRRSHKRHHRFTTPRLFDAFDGSPTDTVCMILVPLATTAQLLHATTWEYAIFGSLWSAWLCLIHSEMAHPWDGLFQRLGLGTAADHHLHHRTSSHNYGHAIMWWDRLVGTYMHTRTNGKQSTTGTEPTNTSES